MNPPYAIKKNYIINVIISELNSLSKISVRIPTYIQSGETADLTCSYYLDSNSLYSIKWYKVNKYCRKKKTINTFHLNSLATFPAIFHTRYLQSVRKVSASSSDSFAQNSAHGLFRKIALFHKNFYTTLAFMGGGWGQDRQSGVLHKK
jgi:hypothetical protein